MAILGLLSLLLSLPLVAAAFLGARWVLAAAAGVPGAWLPFRRFDVPPKGVPRWARPAVGVAGPFAAYLVAALVCVVTVRSDGKPVYDATTIDVLPGGPAEVAGIRSGDRLLSINARPVASFDDISATIREQGKAGALEIVADRGGARITATATPRIGPDGNPKIGVTPHLRHVRVGIGEAISQGVRMPGRILAAYFGALVAGQERKDLAGPVGIVDATAGGPAAAPITLALLVAAYWLTLLTVILALAAIVFAAFGWRPRAS